MGKISGPLLDRIDLHIEVPAVAYQELRGKETGATSAELRERVLAARAIQMVRGSINATAPAGKLREICPLDAAAEKTLEMAVRRLALSACAHDRISKVSRTIADLGGSEQIQAKHIAEAMQHRSLGTSIGSEALSSRRANNPATSKVPGSRERIRSSPARELGFEHTLPGFWIRRMLINSACVLLATD
jgi:magnesium chelatase family protein